jgi:hypothetical protein
VLSVHSKRRYQLLNNLGLETEGIFRLSGSKARMEQAARMWNLGCKVDLHSLGLHSVCGLLKQYYRELPDTIFPPETYEKIRKLNQSGLSQFLKNELIAPMNPILIESYRILFHTLYLVSLSSGLNRMPASNLAIIWTPNFIKDSNPLFLQDPENSGFSILVKMLIDQYNDIFC